MAIKDRYSEFFCGIHSNIPLCCIFWYLSGWENLQPFINETYYDEEYKSPLIRKKVNAEIPYDLSYFQALEYVPCPDCLVRILERRQHPNKLKPCNCGETGYNRLV